jgi:hypothetical protein
MFIEYLSIALIFVISLIFLTFIFLIPSATVEGPLYFLHRTYLASALSRKQFYLLRLIFSFSLILSLFPPLKSSLLLISSGSKKKSGRGAHLFSSALSHRVRAVSTACFLSVAGCWPHRL